MDFSGSKSLDKGITVVYDAPTNPFAGEVQRFVTIYDHHGTIWVKFFSLVVIWNTIWGKQKLDDTLWCCTKMLRPKTRLWISNDFFCAPRWEFSELPQRTAPLFPQAIAAEEGSQRQSLGVLEGRVVMIPAIGFDKNAGISHLKKKCQVWKACWNTFYKGPSILGHLMGCLKGTL